MFKPYSGRHEKQNIDLMAGPKPSADRLVRRIRGVEFGSEEHLTSRAGHLATHRLIDVTLQRISHDAQTSVGMHDELVAQAEQAHTDKIALYKDELPVEAKQMYFTQNQNQQYVEPRVEYLDLI